MEREGPVRRQSPGSRGPYERAHVGANPELVRFLAGHNGKLHPDRWAGMVLAVDVGYSESRAVVNAPVHRLESPIDVAFFEECEECTSDAGFITRIHREVGLFPLAEHSQPLEFTTVRVDVAGSKITAHAPKLRRRHFAGLAAQFLFDFRLDRQAVAIPSRNVGCPE